MIIFHQPPLFEGFARDLEDSVPTDAAAAPAGGLCLLIQPIRLVLQILSALQVR